MRKTFTKAIMLFSAAQILFKAFNKISESFLTISKRQNHQKDPLH
ncbi:MAG: hypothetical protein PHY90_05610 [Desulfitobacteriaceae bacterium]|nr:hypothetical protein [Desulfitobacteriaceae bacterium]